MGRRTRRRRRRVHRTAANSDHLRWSPNFSTSTITTSPTFFITGTRSKSDRKGSKTTSKADVGRRIHVAVPAPSGHGFGRGRWRWVTGMVGFQIHGGSPASLAGNGKPKPIEFLAVAATYRARFRAIPTTVRRDAGRDRKRGRRRGERDRP